MTNNRVPNVTHGRKMAASVSQTSLLPHPSGTQGELRLPLWRRVLLVAVMTGNEVCVSFEQLFEVPLLQTLGVPVTYITLYPAVVGPFSLVLINVLGRLSDRGHNHRRRKMGLVVLNSSIALLGTAVLVTANVLFFLGIGAPPQPGAAVEGVGASDANFTGVVAMDGFQSQAAGSLPMSTYGTNQSDASIVTWLAESIPTAVPGQGYGNASVTQEDADSAMIPVTAVLGIVGFSLLDISYDLSISATRSCLLANSCKPDHTSLLILSLAMAAVGGCMNNLCGLIDFATIFRLGTEAGPVVVQASGHLLVATVVVIFGTVSTILNSLINDRHLAQTGHSVLEEDEAQDSKVYGTIDEDLDAEYGGSVAKLGSYQAQDSHDSCSRPRMDSFQERSLAKDEREMSLMRSGVSTEYLRYVHENPDQLVYVAPKEAAVPEKENGGTATKVSFGYRLLGRVLPSVHPAKFKLAIVCVAMYLGASVIYSYNMYASDFIGKEVMKGDFFAPKGSPELKAYEEGISHASVGMLVNYACFVLFASGHDRLLKLWGPKVDFSLAHFLTATAILVLVVTKHIGAFFVTCVLYAFQRSAIFTVSFIMANNYLNERSAESGVESQRSVGKIMALVGMMIPLNYCTIFMVSGPLITLTGDNGAPLYCACVATYLAGFLFFLHCD